MKCLESTGYELLIIIQRVSETFRFTAINSDTCALVKKSLEAFVGLLSVE